MYFLWTLNEILEIANGCSMVSNAEKSFVDVFGRKLSFCKLYDYVKQHKELILTTRTFLTQLAFVRFVYFLKALNQFLPEESSLPSNPV